jgi:hypothetical protein
MRNLSILSRIFRHPIRDTKQRLESETASNRRFLCWDLLRTVWFRPASGRRCQRLDSWLWFPDDPTVSQSWALVGTEASSFK